MGSSKGKITSAEAELRVQAEKQLCAETTARPSRRSEAGTQSLLHELQVYQVELEMQNESLRKSRDEVETLLDKYTDLYDFSPVGHFTLNCAGAISDVNLAGAALLGVERSRLTGSCIGQFVATESRALFANFIARVFASQDKEHCVVALATTRGNAPVYVHIEAMATASGGECRAVLIDISERKRLEVHNAHLASFPRLNPNPVLETDFDGRIIYYNPATENILESAGLTVADVDLFLPADMVEILKQRDGLHETTLCREIDIKDMSFVVTIFVTPQLSSVRIYAYDITRVKEAEKQARKSQSLYRAIGETIDYGIWICEPDGRNVYASESFLQLVGITQEQCSDFGWGDVLHPDDAERTLTAWKECIRSGCNWDWEHRFRGVDGQWHYVLARGVPVRDEKGTVVNWVGINLDISRMKQVEASLISSQENLEQKVRERTVALSRSNENLRVEVVERKKAEESLLTAYAEIKQLKDRFEAENVYLQREIAKEHNFGEIIGQSAALAHVITRIEQVAPMNATVLLLGETGTGKGVAARAIHSLSTRKHRPMITVNCGALPANLIESELFGRERGAFTGAHARQIGRFELADGGSIFLDEISEMPPELQSKLLRVLQDGEFERLGSPRTIKVDVRIIAASNRDLQEEIKNGRFREDLFYRLNIFPITIPPLRQHKEDIPLLVNHFVDRFNKKNGRKIDTVSKQTLHSLQAYHWPGNVRELESIIERAVITSPGSTLEIQDRLEAHTGPVELAGAEARALIELEQDHILKVLRQTGWRVEGERGAAIILGLNPSTLRARMRKYGIKRQ